MRTHEEFRPQPRTPRSVPPLAGARRSVARERRSDERFRNDLYEIAARITHIDRAIIRSHFQDNVSILPVERRETHRQPTLPMWLPSAVHQTPLPRELERKLSLLPQEYARVLVGRDVLLIESATGTVIDILHQVRAPGA